MSLPLRCEKACCSRTKRSRLITGKVLYGTWWECTQIVQRDAALSPFDLHNHNFFLKTNICITNHKQELKIYTPNGHVKLLVSKSLRFICLYDNYFLKLIFIEDLEDWNFQIQRSSREEKEERTDLNLMHRETVATRLRYGSIAF